jgi:hypothetical protein
MVNHRTGAEEVKVLVNGKSAEVEGRGPKGVLIRYENGQAEWVHEASVAGASPAANNGNDPFESMARQLAMVRQKIARDYESADERQARRKDQIKRLDAVLRLLTGERPASGAKAAAARWTPERRAAAAERMRARNRAKAEVQAEADAEAAAS